MLRQQSPSRDTLYAYPHVKKTGGTSLSLVLAQTTHVLCGSRPSDDLTDEALNACGRGVPVPVSAGSLDYIPNGDNYVPSTTTPVRANVSSVYGHVPSVEWLQLRFPTARLLLLLRRPVPHRLTWFQEAKGTARTFVPRNFSAWIRSPQYASYEQSLQLRHYAPLLRDSARSGTAAAAAALLAHPRVAWVGVSDNWLASMLLLEQLLDVPLVSFAAQLHTRFKGGALFSRKDAAHRRSVAIGDRGTVDGHQVQWTTPAPAAGSTDWITEVSERDIGIAVRLGSGAAFYSPEKASSLMDTVAMPDYRHLLFLEAEEVQFVDAVERTIQRRVADMARAKALSHTPFP
jgi:hypothetical protein